ncbi:Odorant receptor 6 [Blattella germanica]|nr:Odorant receptor 6 [Blattella germanica]
MLSKEPNNGKCNDNKENNRKKLDLVSLQLKILTYFAILPPANAKRDSWISRFYLAFCYLLLFWYIPMFAFDMMAIPQNPGNLPLITEVIFEMSASTTAGIASSYFIFNRHRVTEIFEMLETRFEKFINNKTVSETNFKCIFMKVSKIAKIVTYTIAINVCLLVAAWICLPYTRRIMDETSGNVHDESKPEFWGYFCYIMWIPEKPLESPTYECLYLFQISCVLMVICHYTAMNTIFFFIIIYTLAYFQLLTTCITDIDKRFPIENGSKCDSEINRRLFRNLHGHVPKESHYKTKSDSCRDDALVLTKDTNDGYLYDLHNDKLTAVNEELANGLEDDAVEHLKQCIEFHQSLLEYYKSVNSFLSPIYLAFFLSNEISMCVSVFQLLVNENNGIMKIIIGAINACSWPLIISWCGDYLTEKSKELESAIYEMQWYKRSERFKKLLFINLLGAQKPVRMTAGKFFDVSLQSFAEIVNKVYAYFTILKKMYDT